MSSSNLQLIRNALDNYVEQMKIDLTDNPFAEQVKNCETPSAVLQLLETSKDKFKEYRDKNRKFLNCLDPVVRFVHAFSGILDEAASLVSFKPAKMIFVGIDVLFAAAEGVSASYDALLELFECIGSFLKRLEIYTRISLSPLMTEIIVKIMVELLSILAQAKKQIKQGRFKQFTKKLLGDKEIENILRRLDRLTQDEARMTEAHILEVVHGLMNNMKVVMDGGETSIIAIRKSLVTIQDVVTKINKMDRDRFHEKSLSWLSPPDPSQNQVNARNDNHDGSAVWLTQSGNFKEWNAKGCLLWIHGKSGSGKSILCSTIVEESMALRAAGLGLTAYYYFDFRNTAKQDLRGLLSSLLVQLCAKSDLCYEVLSHLYSTYDNGSRSPDNRALAQCLMDMLGLPAQPTIYLIIDALDECPNTGLASQRDRVLKLLEDLVKLQLPNVRICATGCPEADILEVLTPLASHTVSIPDEDGQKKDIIDYVTFVVYSDRKMRKWTVEEKKLVIDTISEKAGGMFRWVICQLEVLRHRLPGTIAPALKELPKTLDETYGRILLGIDKDSQEYALCLFRRLCVSIRPLYLADLAEVFAVSFDTGRDLEGRVDWQSIDAQKALLSTCSSLITVVNVDGFPVVQFAHFTVKEFLTSDRLAKAGEHLSRFHIKYISEEAPPDCHRALVRDEDLARLDGIDHSTPIDGLQSAEVWSHIQKPKPIILDNRIDLSSTRNSASADTESGGAGVATHSNVFEEQSPLSTSSAPQSLHNRPPLPPRGRPWRNENDDLLRYAAPPSRFAQPNVHGPDGDSSGFSGGRYTTVMYPTYPRPTSGYASAIPRLESGALQLEMGHADYYTRPPAPPQVQAYAPELSAPPLYSDYHSDYHGGFSVTLGPPDILEPPYPPGPSGPPSGVRPSYPLYHAPERTRQQVYVNEPSQPYTPRVAQKKALMVGINYSMHPDLRFRLKWCVNDAYEIARFLQEHCGFPRNNMRILTDDQHDNLPTKANILAAMHWLVDGAQPGDSLFFYYSGHATQLEDLGCEEADGFDECLCTMEYAPRSGELLPSPDTPGIIVDDQIHDIMVKPLPRGCRLTAVLECCHSGNLLDLPFIYDLFGKLKRWSPEVVQRKESAADVISLSACKDSERAFEAREGGALRKAFVEYVETSGNRGSYLDVIRGLRAYMRAKNFNQKPQLSSSHDININQRFMI